MDAPAPECHGRVAPFRVALRNGPVRPERTATLFITLTSLLSTRLAWLPGQLSLVVLIAFAIGTGAAVSYYVQDLTLSHYDAKAHLVVARRVVEAGKGATARNYALLAELLRVRP